jgi:hypothetical protein
MSVLYHRHCELSLVCDKCIENKNTATFIGETLYDCHEDAKSEGWRLFFDIFLDDFTLAYCPQCNKENK